MHYFFKVPLFAAVTLIPNLGVAGYNSYTLAGSPRPERRAYSAEFHMTYPEGSGYPLPEEKPKRELDSFIVPRDQVVVIEKRLRVPSRVR